MSEVGLPDDGQRARIASELDRTLFVEAAAGTGKTTALVERITRLVASGETELHRVAAITFTEKAAAELRDRLRRGLVEGAASAAAGEAERCRRALGALDDAAVCTIHAFAHRLLAEHPLEAGLPPRFEVLDPIEAASELDAAWERFAGALLDEEGDDVRRALALGLRPSHLRELAVALHAHWDRVEGRPIPEHADPQVDAGAVLVPLERAWALLAGCAPASDDGMARHLEDLAPWAELLRDAADGGDDLAVLTTYADAPKLTGRRTGSQTEWGKEEIAAVRELLDEAHRALRTQLDGTRTALVARLGEAVRRFVLDAAERRRRSGRIELHDLLVHARRLLRGHPGVRHALRTRWQRLLIDEFQDTDPLQAELAALLAATTDGDGGHEWWDLEVEPGRLFLVGDPKQSIYRFRRADVALYLRTRERLADEHDRVPLTTNFRCAPAIVEWVNHVFGALMGDGHDGAQAPYTPLAAHREPEAPSVQALGGPDDRAVAEIREREAADVAAVVARARGEGWIVHDRDGAPRRCRYSDVAVLLPTRRLLPSLERALSESGIPHRIESRSLLWSTQEVRDLLSVLRAVDDPADEIALVAALRSPAFACRDDELLEFRRAGGAWDVLAPPPEALDTGHPVVAAMGEIAALHGQRHWMPLHTSVERVLRELRLREVQTALPRPRDRWRRLRFVADQARAFDEAGAGTLREFVDWADQQAEERALVNDSILAEADDDAVRIMTVHAAKGLEFPVVVTAGLNAAAPPLHAPVLFADDGRPEIGLGRKDHRFATPDYEDRRKQEQQAEEHERIRLLYVACTRARDHLVVSLHRKRETGRTVAHRIAAECEAVESLWQPAQATGSAEHGSDEGPDGATAVTPRDRWLEEREELRREAVAPAVAATAVGGEVGESDEAGEEPPEAQEPLEMPEAPPWRRGRAGTSVGRAVHAVLQTVELDALARLDRAAEAQAAAEGIADRAGDVRRLARAALSAPVVREAIASGRVWREVPVGVEIDGTVLEGFVDLLFEASDGLTVVDYKTDRSDPDEVARRYRLQGAAYAAALEEILGRGVARCVFVVVGEGHAEQVEIPDLAAAVEEVRALLTERRPPSPENVTTT